MSIETLKPDNLEFNCKIFADDTSLFYKVFDRHVSRAAKQRFRIKIFNGRCSLIETEISKLKNYIFLKK